MAQTWKTSRGKLGALAPLIGSWSADGEQNGLPFTCTRTFSLYGKDWVRMDSVWSVGKPRSSSGMTDSQRKVAAAYSGKSYCETSFIGPGADGVLCFWSFTNDGKRSEGQLADASDIHPQALAFEADMPAGRARQVYWPDEAEGVQWAVEAKTKTGWRRFTEHHYRKVD